jgi:hypothetical protein
MSRIIEMGDCPVHGRVVVFNITDITRPGITTGPLCQTCYIEWTKENVTHVENVQPVVLG